MPKIKLIAYDLRITHRPKLININVARIFEVSEWTGFADLDGRERKLAAFCLMILLFTEHTRRRDALAIFGREKEE